MITRFAMFEGTVADENITAFRAAVHERLVPLWTQFPGNVDVRVMFSDDRDEGAPEYPVILAITYKDEAGMVSALDSPYRAQSRDVTGEIVAQYLTGKIHHHVTELNLFPAP